MKKHLFFDLDRTLWDFDGNSRRALIKLYETATLESSELNFTDFHDHYVQVNAALWKAYGKKEITKDFLRDERFRKTLENWKLDDPTLIKHFSDGYVELSPKQTELFPNTIETLSELKNIGYEMHIITNGFKEVQYPKIFQYALTKAGTTAEHSFMIGDDYEVDILGAEGVGMKAVHFNPQIQNNQIKYINQITNLSQLPWKLLEL